MSRTVPGWGTAVLVAATVTMGLNAGFFYTWFFNVMPGLHAASDRTFVESFQRMDDVISDGSGWFVLFYVGAPLLTLVAAVLHRRAARTVLPWVLVALALTMVQFGITVGIHLPLNEDLADAGPVDRIPDLAAVRTDFEDEWVLWNNVRTVVSAAAFGCITWALVKHRREPRGTGTGRAKPSYVR